MLRVILIVIKETDFIHYFQTRSCSAGMDRCIIQQYIIWVLGSWCILNFLPLSSKLTKLSFIKILTLFKFWAFFHWDLNSPLKFPQSTGSLKTCVPFPRDKYSARRMPALPELCHKYFSKVPLLVHNLPTQYVATQYIYLLPESKFSTEFEMTRISNMTMSNKSGLHAAVFFQNGGSVVKIIEGGVSAWSHVISRINFASRTDPFPMQL